jgi:hypothetical protein
MPAEFPRILESESYVAASTPSGFRAAGRIFENDDLNKDWKRTLDDLENEFANHSGCRCDFGFLRYWCAASTGAG